MGRIENLIQGLIIFSTVLGVFFLWQAYPLLPSFVFYSLTVGWVLFLVDSVLTFVRPRASYYVALVLAPVALIATLSQPEHYSLVSSGDLPATITLILGSASQIALTVAVLYYLLARRRAGHP